MELAIVVMILLGRAPATVQGMMTGLGRAPATSQGTTNGPHPGFPEVTSYYDEEMKRTFYNFWMVE